MKRITFPGLMLAAAIICLLAVTALTARADGRPAVATVTLPGGGTNVAALAYTAGIGQDVYVAFQPLAYEITFTSALPDEKTVTIRRVAGGPVYKTITVSSNATQAVSFETNAWWFLRGDSMHITSTATNAATIRIIGNEK